ncbi:MAG: DUF3465 domain-containing protein [Candidatus Dormibacteria bacterium]
MFAGGACALLISACGGVNNQALYDASRNHAVTEVSVQGTVTHLQADSTSSVDGPHQRFNIDVGHGLTCQVIHNLSLAPRVPVQTGNTVTVKGQFEPDPAGCVIHYTHHTTSSHHESGYIELNGQTYS